MDELGHDEILKRKYLARGAGDAATKAYIASKYLSGDNGSKKKKKKKSSSSGIKKGNIGIIDDEDIGWGTQTEEDILKKTLKEENEALEQAALNNAGGIFKGTASNWQTIREGVVEQEEDEEDRPVVIKEEEVEKTGPRMSTGQKAGLLTGSALKAEFERAREAETKNMERLRKESQGENADTVYRDSSGRKMDPKMKRAEEARKRQEEIEREARRMEWGKGLVQRQEAEEKQKLLEAEKHKPMARYVDDEDLNEELKEKERWNDPAAGFLTKKTSKSKGKRFVKPAYKGPWKPNRFGIPPGYRWDGVDRSTGYEDKFLLAQNQRKVRAEAAHAMSTEDM